MSTTKVAVVTGSNKGIGLAIVRALCKQYDGNVYITARDVGRGEAATASLVADGLKPKFHQLDINDLQSIAAAAAYFKETYGGVDVLVNNAAIAFKEADTSPFAVQAERCRIWCHRRIFLLPPFGLPLFVKSSRDKTERRYAAGDKRRLGFKA
ncbi:Carbonyl reductase [NADPH] 1 [Liparis tanakae]|uniref:Carbonyl reductase [NADPH] 1 n=1 Tax=Liparis tanakae TaxID=230148 RepID=A0A4Z2GXA8_9TELE|nr:Carbonyl reductase [NADPH] 1 [Liparis tanakae]